MTGQQARATSGAEERTRMTEQRAEATRVTMAGSRAPAPATSSAVTAPRGPLRRRGVALAAVFGGGAVGTAAREALSLAFPSTGDLPAATWAINVGGSLLLGFLLGLLVTGGLRGPHRGLRLALGTGFCGGFTTYSTLAQQSASLAGDDLWGAGILYASSTLVVGAVAAWAGIAAGAAAAHRRADARGAGAAR